MLICDNHLCAYICLQAVYSALSSSLMCIYICRPSTVCCFVIIISVYIHIIFAGHPFCFVIIIDVYIYLQAIHAALLDRVSDEEKETKEM